MPFREHSRLRMRIRLLLGLGLGCHFQCNLALIPSTRIFRPETFRSSLPTSTKSTVQQCQPTRTALHAYWDNNSYSSNGNNKRNPKANNINRTCIKHFLTQRAVQSFMFLLENCRDPHTVKWMEDYSGTPNMLQFHGTGAFNITRFENWDSFLMEMVERKKEVVVVSAKRRGAGTGGWSTNNPYLKPRYVEYDIDIDPPSLASRILSVREQLSKEWTTDLDLVVKSGDVLLDTYFNDVALERDNESVDSQSKEKKKSTSTRMFERGTLALFNELNPYDDRGSSPFRKGNFDLLHLLATQESIHRVLRELKEAGSKMEISFAWLRDFYYERIPNFFDGNQRYGRYDDFLEELLQSIPTLKNEGRGQVSIIDPIGLTEKIIRMRGAVALEWKDIMISTPEDHTDLRRSLLNKQMLRSVTDELDKQLESSETEEPMSMEEIFEDKMGEFE